MTTISRIFGLVRDIVIANIFGAGTGSDAFFVAFKIPNYLRRLFAEGGFSQAFVPVLTEYKNQCDEAGVRDLLDHVSGKLSLMLFCVTVVGVVAAPLMIMIFAPGFMGDESKYDLSVYMLRITFPYILFISLTAFAGGILNAYGRFAVPAFTPVLLNISLITCAIWLAPMLDQPITALAWGVLFAGILQLLFQIPFLLGMKRLPRPRLKKDHSGVRKILKLMIPALFAISISQINLVIDMLMASFLVTGSISWLYYSDRLMEFPLGVFGVALAVVILPNLSEKHTQGDTRSFSQMMDWALKWVFLISFPAALGLMLLAGPMLTTIFQHGEFTPFHVEMSSKSLLTYAIGLPGFILTKVLLNGYFSRQETKTPVKIGVIAMFANIIMNLIFIGPLAHAGLALATSLAAFINAGLLFYFLRKGEFYLPENDWLVFIGRIIFASLVMSALLFYMPPAISLWIGWDVFTRVIQLAIWIVAGGASYFAALWLSGLRLKNMTLNAGRGQDQD
ncbi:MAG: putative peptidoglycan lipid II flippase [Gammaproteobacteria bacterium]|jgi:putative peptidoglycan lipid II flippase